MVAINKKGFFMSGCITKFLLCTDIVDKNQPLDNTDTRFSQTQLNTIEKIKFHLYAIYKLNITIHKKL